MSPVKISIALAAACLLSSHAQAVVITGPINYTTANLVGTADPGTESADVDAVRALANNILALGAGVTDGIYRTHDTDDYNATLTGGVRVDTGDLLNIAAGWEYVMAKYDGQNAGYVLFYLGGEASTIPETSDSIWVNTQEKGYGISGYTVFNSVSRVPEPGALSLLGAGLLALGAIRRRRRM